MTDAGKVGLVCVLVRDQLHFCLGAGLLLCTPRTKVLPGNPAVYFGKDALLQRLHNGKQRTWRTQ